MIARFRAWLGREHGESSLLVLMLVPIIVLVGFGAWYVILIATIIAVPYAKGDPKGRNCNWEAQW